MIKPTKDAITETSNLTISRGIKSRKAIFSAAAKLFSQHGYAAISLRNIAADAGIKAGSIYHHFESKEKIVEEILNTAIKDVFKHVRESVEALPDNTEYAVQIHTAITAHLEALHAGSDYTSAYVRIFWQLPEAPRKSSQDVRFAYEEYWRDLLNAARENGCIRPDVNLTIFRLFLLGALNASIEWFDPSVGGVDPVAKDYANILLKGLILEPGDSN